MTWRECKLVPRQVDFKVPKVDCVEGEAIPYTDCEDTEKVQMTTRQVREMRVCAFENAFFTFNFVPDLRGKCLVS